MQRNSPSKAFSKFKMAVDYASGLTDYPHKGKCGAPEVCYFALFWINLVVQIYSV